MLGKSHTVNILNKTLCSISNLAECYKTDNETILVFQEIVPFLNTLELYNLKVFRDIPICPEV